MSVKSPYKVIEVLVPDGVGDPANPSAGEMEVRVDWAVYMS
jgi:hypothetical protein